MDEYNIKYTLPGDLKLKKKEEKTFEKHIKGFMWKVVFFLGGMICGFFIHMGVMVLI